MHRCFWDDFEAKQPNKKHAKSFYAKIYPKMQKYFSTPHLSNRLRPRTPNHLRSSRASFLLSSRSATLAGDRLSTFLDHLINLFWYFSWILVVLVDFWYKSATFSRFLYDSCIFYMIFASILIDFSNFCVYIDFLQPEIWIFWPPAA